MPFFYTSISIFFAMRNLNNRGLRPAKLDIGTPDLITAMTMAMTNATPTPDEPAEHPRTLEHSDWTLEFDDEGEPSVHYTTRKKC